MQITIWKLQLTEFTCFSGILLALCKQWLLIILISLLLENPIVYHYINYEARNELFLSYPFYRNVSDLNNKNSALRNWTHVVLSKKATLIYLDRRVFELYCCIRLLPIHRTRISVCARVIDR